MSSTESSGAPAEATATTPASNAAPSFGSTRGSGLLRGKAKRPSAPAATSAAPSDYTPTAIEVVTAPREYQNPFAPVETPAAATPEAAPVGVAPAAPSVPTRPERVAEVAPVKAYSAPVAEPAPTAEPAESAPAPESDEPAALNILEPAAQKTSPAQTWESEGFRPAREVRNDRPRREEARREEPRREERTERTPIDPASIPAKFLYVRPGYNYVPTPANYGGAPRDRASSPVSAPAYAPSAPAAAVPEKSGGFFGWLKSLFGGSAPAAVPAETRPTDLRNGDRHRGGRGRGQGGGGQYAQGGDGQRRRSRGGRGRNQSRGEYRGGGDQGGPAAT